MKLSKTTLLAVAGGAFIIILAGVSMLRFQQTGQQDELNERLAAVQSNLARVQLKELSSQQVELKKQLNEAALQLEAVKATFSQPIGSVAATDILINTAKAHDLEITEIISSSPTSESLEGGVTCSVLSLTTKVEGDVPSLVSLVTELNSAFTTGVVKSMTITVPETTSEEKTSVDIQLVVYTHQEE